MTMPRRTDYASVRAPTRGILHSIDLGTFANGRSELELPCGIRAPGTSILLSLGPRE